MEKAILINRIDQLKFVNKDYSRLYFGNEFCERSIPPVRDLENILSFIQKKRLNFTLVTPYVTNLGLAKLKPLLEMLGRGERGYEIIINDWGVLNLVNREFKNLLPVLGRLLTKQKRCPQLIKLLKRQMKTCYLKNLRNPKIKSLVVQRKLPLDLDPYYKGSNSSSVPIIHSFLSSQRIQRIELDNIGQGLFLGLPGKMISASVYVPYVYISTTFFCLSAGCDQKKKSWLKYKPCSQECQRYVFKLRHRAMPKVIYLKGNTQFYKNTRLHCKDWEKAGIDRIVYQPQIPG